MFEGEKDIPLVFLSGAGQWRLSRSLPFSRSRIFNLAACDSSSAANMPAGPAPTMMTSYSLFMRSPPHKIAQRTLEAQASTCLHESKQGHGVCPERGAGGISCRESEGVPQTLGSILLHRLLSFPQRRESILVLGGPRFVVAAESVFPPILASAPKLSLCALSVV